MYLESVCRRIVSVVKRDVYAVFCSLLMARLKGDVLIFGR